MGLLKDIKKAVRNSGASKGKFIYFKADTKTRVRFLQDVEDGIKVPFHDSFALGINVPCQEIYGRECKYCGDEDLRHRDLFAWSVYDYDANEVKILMAGVSSFSPIPSLIAMYEEYGTLLDRDYVIGRTGSQLNTSYSVIPMDKATFKNKKAKAFSHKEMLDLIDKAHPTEETDTDTREEPEVEDDWDDEEEEETDYNEMTVKELYKLCKDRKLDVEPRKKKAYYIEILEEDDLAVDDDIEDEDWDDEDEDEEW
jgi:hypothetical protein